MNSGAGHIWGLRRSEAEHEVHVIFHHSEDMHAHEALARELSELLRDRGVGRLLVSSRDGKKTEMAFTGPDADTIWQVLEPAVARVVDARGVVVKRFGSSGGPEETLRLTT